MVQARKEMQALASEDLRNSLFGFEGADKAPTLWRERKREADIKVRLGRKLSLAYFLSRKKVCAFSSVGRATDS